MHRRRLRKSHARALRRFHALAMVGWTAMVPVTLFTGLKSSIPYVSFISVYALIVGHASSWAGESAAMAAEEAADK